MLHYTGMASGEAALARLLDPAAEVSAHYLVWEDGAIDQLVAEADRAWHAGHSSWAGESDLNSRSVGIEIVNGGHAFGLPPYPPVQVAAVAALVGDVRTRRNVSAARVLGHSDIAPARKEDPGEHFPWHILAAAGSAAALPVEPPEIAAGAGEALAAIGYENATAAARHHAIVAFQRRWRPARVDGALDEETAALIEAVRRAHPASGHTDRAIGV